MRSISETWRSDSTYMPSVQSDTVRRVLLTAAAIGVFSLYMVTNHAMNGTPAPSLATSLDRAIPFWPPAQLIYFSVYLFVVLPAFLVRDMRAFTRTVYGFCATQAVAYSVFLLFPTRYIERPAAFPIDSLFSWGVAFNYVFDPPYNNFPSLHVGNSMFAAFIALRIDRKVGWGAMALAIAIAASTLLVKQHWIVDVVAGTALAYASYRFIVLPGIPKDKTREELAFPRSYVLGLCVVYLLIVVVVAILYKSGWQPFVWPQPVK